MSRSDFCITSKQGFIGTDSFDSSSAELLVREAIDATGLKFGDFIGGQYGYCIDPAFLDYSLKRSLESLGLVSLDVVIVARPYEIY